MADKTIEQLNELLKESEEKNASLEKEIAAEKEAHAKTADEALSVNSELQKKLELKESLQKSDMPTVTIAKVVYQSKFKKINYKNRVISAEQLVADKELCQELIGIGSGVLKKVSK